MNPEESLTLNDKEIEKITTTLNKAGKREFGESFKNAAARTRENVPPAPAQNEKEKFLSAIQNPAEPGVDVTTLHADNAPLEKKELYALVKPVRTYERDIAEAIRTKNESVASVNIAAQKKREEKGETRPAKMENAAGKGLSILISVVLLVSAAGIFALVYYFYSHRPAPIIATELSILATDEKQVIDITGKSAVDVLVSVANEIQKPIQVGKLTRIELTENSESISIKKFFELFSANAPATLVRAIGPQWIFGSNNAGTNEPFIFVSVNSFNTAFDGMHQWEKTLAKNLGPIFIKEGTIIPETNTITGTNFTDVVILNKDARALKDNNGNIVLLYSFLDQKNLLITSNEKTFREILNRFFASQIVR